MPSLADDPARDFGLPSMSTVPAPAPAGSRIGHPAYRGVVGRMRRAGFADDVIEQSLQRAKPPEELTGKMGPGSLPRAKAGSTSDLVSRIKRAGADLGSGIKSTLDGGILDRDSAARSREGAGEAWQHTKELLGLDGPSGPGRGITGATPYPGEPDRPVASDVDRLFGDRPSANLLERGYDATKEGLREFEAMIGGVDLSGNPVGQALNTGSQYIRDVLGLEPPVEEVAPRPAGAPAQPVPTAATPAAARRADLADFSRRIGGPEITQASFRPVAESPAGPMSPELADLARLIHWPSAVSAAGAAPPPPRHGPGRARTETAPFAATPGALAAGADPFYTGPTTNPSTRQSPELQDFARMIGGDLMPRTGGTGEPPAPTPTTAAAPPPPVRTARSPAGGLEPDRASNRVSERLATIGNAMLAFGTAVSGAGNADPLTALAQGLTAAGDAALKRRKDLSRQQIEQRKMALSEAQFALETMKFKADLAKAGRAEKPRLPEAVDAATVLAFQGINPEFADPVELENATRAFGILLQAMGHDDIARAYQEVSRLGSRDEGKSEADSAGGGLFSRVSRWLGLNEGQANQESSGQPRSILSEVGPGGLTKRQAMDKIISSYRDGPQTRERYLETVQILKELGVKPPAQGTDSSKFAEGHLKKLGLE